MLYHKQTYTSRDQALLLLRCAPVHGAAYLLQALLSGLSPTLTILATARFIDTALAIATGAAEMADAFAPVAFVLVLMLYERLIGTVMNYVGIGLENRVRRVARAEMLDRRAALCYRHIEHADTRDLIDRVCGDCDGRIRSMFHNLLTIFTLILKIGGFIGILLAHVWWAVPAAAALCVPLYFLGLRSGKQNYEAERETTKLKRRYEYLSRLLIDRETLEERYLFGYEPSVDREFHTRFEQARLHLKRVNKRSFTRMKTGSVALMAIMLGLGAVLIGPVLSGTLSVGLFTSLLSSLSGMVNMMGWSIGWTLSEYAKNKEYLRDLTAFFALETEPEAAEPPVSPPPPFETLEFRRVSFRYPGTEQYVLRDLSFVLERGTHCAVVGVNGAGKTTLTKLITGLYREYEGEILLNGRELRTCTQAELKALTMVVFQDFARYSISIFDNIALGDIRRFEADRDPAVLEGPDRPKADLTSSIGRAVERSAGLLHLEDILAGRKDGYDTLLGKIYPDGADLSGGQWQRLAFARAVTSPAPLRILDEPTAALDPISESRVYGEFEQLSDGTTTIFISHRLGSIRLAQSILVLSEGAVAESGTHEELMALNGLYAAMYRSQADWYREDAQEGAAEYAG